MLMCVHHTRLRTLVRTLAVADEKTGLLARGSYIDCLLQESQRARTQGIPLALALLQIDGGPDLMRLQGEGPFDRYMELLGEAVHGIIRQSDLAIKYTSWALAIVLPDTPLSGARMFAEKLRKAVGDEPMEPKPGGYISQHVSLGAATWDGRETAEELCGRAAAALRDVKSRGGDAVGKAVPSTAGG